ncbi:hypothetical protein LSTR_LSTR003910 [Laodelphax striatellus]|uniref:Uncharacterized protein n=1 Tax=Laodelphax striatellus TaxID=195883 RepID=A0A482X9E9_LAOST|nr:hypothetical protein LSTR_LSTR003910 [Laodelphax striatellus]
MIRNGTNSLGRPYRPRSSTSETIPFADSPDSPPSLITPKIPLKTGATPPPLTNCRTQMGRSTTLPLPPPPPSPPHRIHMIDTEDTTSLNNILDAINDLPDQSSEEGSVADFEEEKEEDDCLTPLRSLKAGCRLNLQNDCRKQGNRNVQILVDMSRLSDTENGHNDQMTVRQTCSPPNICDEETKLFHDSPETSSVQSGRTEQHGLAQPHSDPPGLVACGGRAVEQIGELIQCSNNRLVLEIGFLESTVCTMDDSFPRGEKVAL